MTDSYEIHLLKRIDSLDEELTFHYNSHSNIDLFIDYGFVLRNNPFNCFNVEEYIESLLSSEQIELLKSLNYFQELNLYSSSIELSWTLIKSIELSFNGDQWSSTDHPSNQSFQQIQEIFHQILHQLEKDLHHQFDQWTTKNFSREKLIFFDDFREILQHNSMLSNELLNS